MTRRLLLPAGAPRPVSYYSHGIHIGSVLYSAGQTSRDASGQLVGIGDVGRQAEQAFYNLFLVLQEAGMGFKDIVRLNIFTCRAEDLPVVFEVAGRYFTGHAPALTAAVVDGLAYPEYLLELEVIAEVE